MNGIEDKFKKSLKLFKNGFLSCKMCHCIYKDDLATLTVDVKIRSQLRIFIIFIRGIK